MRLFPALEEAALASHCGAGLLGLEAKKLCRITDHAQRHPGQSRGSWDRCNIYHTGSFLSWTRKFQEPRFNSEVRIHQTGPAAFSVEAPTTPWTKGVQIISRLQTWIIMP